MGDRGRGGGGGGGGREKEKEKEKYPGSKVKKAFQEAESGLSLVAQWLRICLPMQGHRFEPWSGRIPHATEQLSLCATTTEPAL